ncbi:hypothetical protein [Streptomyces sp. CRN 30]|uniref:hypothetical protein n=1 Tax=Streptomyces sp. CRN 30 TaxID=3075613 RepID=UPI002A8400A3|nr:hypothetical protein [Streptomyces sp. CRN 30]
MTPAEPGRSRGSSGAHVDHSGGVHGSLLAASVVVGAGTLGPFPRAELVLLLVATGVVFWLAHVHAQLFGAHMARRPLDRTAVLRVCREERPILEAALPPAAAVALGSLLGLDLWATGWLALGVAVSGQVYWSATAARRARAPWPLVVRTGAVNLVLGLLIVALKAVLKH